MTDQNWALKEWEIAVDALLAGELILLIRKGGIHETQTEFNVPSRRALLFPTYEHQSAAALRPPWRSRVPAQSVPTVGATVSLPGWAEVTHQLPLTGPDIELRLQPFHIWTDAWLTERLAWKPERPTYALLLRAHRFTESLLLTYEQRYGGCRSWLELKAMSEPSSVPVLSEEQYQQQVTDLRKAIGSVATVEVFPS